eukprot:5814408-Amphidinium_carterae.1
MFGPSFQRACIFKPCHETAQFWWEMAEMTPPPPIFKGATTAEEIAARVREIFAAVADENPTKESLKLYRQMMGEQLKYSRRNAERMARYV